MTFDIRFLRHSTPVARFLGHENPRFAHRLGHAVDPLEEFLFVAGSSSRNPTAANCIRIWSLHTSKLLGKFDVHPSGANDSADRTRLPPGAEWDVDVTTLQVTEEGDDGLCLWAGQGKDFHKYYLGQKDALAI
jgi:hypothetical protein